MIILRDRAHGSLLIKNAIMDSNGVNFDHIGVILPHHLGILLHLLILCHVWLYLDRAGCLLGEMVDIAGFDGRSQRTDLA